MTTATSSPPRADRHNAITDPAALTPVERHGSYWFKRDDRYLPFPDLDVNGGKVRQAQVLMRARLATIKGPYHGEVITATSVHSPQGLIIARVARSLDVRCRLFVGATTVDGAMRHRMMRTAVEHCAAELDASTRIGYDAAIVRTMHDYQQRERRGFIVRFGMNLDRDPDAILGTTAAQAANIPRDVSTVVVPVGSGITAAGILRGVAELAPQVSRVVLVQIAGIERRPLIRKLTSTPFEWHTSRAFAYARQVRVTIAPGFTLDPIYEAKAFLEMRWLSLPPDRTLFWVVGDSGFVR